MYRVTIYQTPAEHNTVIDERMNDLLYDVHGKQAKCAMLIGVPRPFPSLQTVSVGRISKDTQWKVIKMRDVDTQVP